MVSNIAATTSTVLTATVAVDSGACNRRARLRLFGQNNEFCISLEIAHPTGAGV